MPDIVNFCDPAIARNLVRLDRTPDGRVRATLGDGADALVSHGDDLPRALLSLFFLMQTFEWECCEDAIDDVSACSVPLGVLVRRSEELTPRSWEAVVVNRKGLWEKSWSSLSPWRALANLALNLAERGVVIDVPAAS